MATLRCHYQTNTNPFLKIGPIKVEEFSLNPYIVVYHDFIHDNEIDYIKDLAKPKVMQKKNYRKYCVFPIKTKFWLQFQRSTTAGIAAAKDTEIISSRRTSKSAFLEYNRVIEKIYQRISAVTGLSADNCEQLQVVNYGIGGHYGPHYDFLPDNLALGPSKLGNRISTLLIYVKKKKTWEYVYKK